MLNKQKEKDEFLAKLKHFAGSLSTDIVDENDFWKIKGFIDSSKRIYSISTDTKIISKIIEIQVFPLLLKFARENDFDLILAECQNWYPDVSLVNKHNKEIKFAIDLKTTYKDEKANDRCNGFTLGSHGEYFINRSSTKNIQFPYNEYLGHYCLGFIYSRNDINKNEELTIHNLNDLENIKSVIKNFIFFAEEKWKIASDKGGSGNTANIGSIRSIKDILGGNGTFAKAGEEIFDDYWCNFGKIEITKINEKTGKICNKKMTSFKEYIKYRNLSEELLNNG